MKIKLSTYIAVIASALFSFSGCNSENAPDCLKKAGATTTVTRPFSDISEVEIYDMFNVKFVKDTACYAVVRAGENLINGVDTDINADNVLTLHDNNSCYAMRNNDNFPEVEIHYKNLSTVIVEGSAVLSSTDSVDIGRFEIRSDVCSADLISNAEYLSVCAWHTSGTFNISGKVERFGCDIRGSIIVNAQNLSCNLADIVNFSSGNIYVNSKDYINAELLWSGNIIYKGNPKINIIRNSGDGQLIQKND